MSSYHRHNFSKHSFDFFDPQKLKGSAAAENPILFNKIDFGLLAVKDPGKELAETQDVESRLQEEFDECLRKRVTY